MVPDQYRQCTNDQRQPMMSKAIYRKSQPEIVAALGGYQCDYNDSDEWIDHCSA